MQQLKFIIIFLILPFLPKAQLCQGSLGEAIINNTFGTGSNPGAALSAATTAYQYKNGDCPGDGFYTVANYSSGCFNSTWHIIPKDHTGDANGYFMLINASIQPSPFFIDTVRGLCSNSVFEFATYIANVLKPTACGSVGIPPNITFSIEKLDGAIIQTYNSGNILSTNALEWKQYGFFFTTPAGVIDIILRITNNATGGCGNDLAIDDITFKPCGPLVTPNIAGLPTNTGTVCQGEVKNFTFNTTTSAGYSNPAYQWQQSFNGGVYTDIVGANTNSFVKNFLSNTPLGLYKYRVKVAEAGNLGSSLCSVFSTPITITIVPKPSTTISTQNTFCENTTLTIAATGGANYNWTGPNNFTSIISDVAIPNVQAIQQGNYVVNITDANGCQKTENIFINILPKPAVTTTFTDSTICFDKTIVLTAISSNNISWLPANILNTATGNVVTAKPIINTTIAAIATNALGCTDTAFINVTVIKKPVVNAGVDKVIVANRPTILNGSIDGEFESYSWQPLDFITNQNTLNPTINPPTDAAYQLVVLSKNGCGLVSDEVLVKIYQGIFVPNAFSPNGDGKNDSWNVPALEAYPLHELAVYNRFGQIVFSRKQSFTKWNGTYKGIVQPAGNYTFIIDLKNNTPLLKGNILLLR